MILDRESLVLIDLKIMESIYGYIFGWFLDHKLLQLDLTPSQGQF